MSDKEDAYAHAKEVLEGDQEDERKHVVSICTTVYRWKIVL